MTARVGPLRTVREVDSGARHLEDPRGRFRSGSLMVDLLVLREPVVNLPRRAALGDPKLPDGAPNPRSGLARLRAYEESIRLDRTWQQH